MEAVDTFELDLVEHEEDREVLEEPVDELFVAVFFRRP